GADRADRRLVAHPHGFAATALAGNPAGAHPRPVLPRRHALAVRGGVAGAAGIRRAVAGGRNRSVGGGSGTGDATLLKPRGSRFEVRMTNEEGQASEFFIRTSKFEPLLR